MTIKEVEERARMERANIRFYEKEGLISPRRLENGYRDYSEEDLEILLRVRLLRSLQVSLEEIHKLKEGREDLERVLDRQMKWLAQQKAQMEHAQEICRRMQLDRVSFENLDARKYLDDVSSQDHYFGQKEEGDFYFLKADVVPREYCPFRRYFARMFDYCFYALCWEAILGLVLRVNLTKWTEGWQKGIDIIAALVIMLLLEPVFLHFFRTTPGKWILGIRIESPLGRTLTYKEGLDRTIEVIWFGLGAMIPLYSLYRLYKSFDDYAEDRKLHWEYESMYSYTFQDTGNYRCVLCVLAYGGQCVLALGVVLAQLIPPNLGKLTIEEFAENMNYYAEYLDSYEPPYYDIEYMDETGQWRKKSESNNTGAYMDEDGNFIIIVGEDRDTEGFEYPHYTYVLDEDLKILYISFHQKIEEKCSYVSKYSSYMTLTTLSFVGAKAGTNVFTLSFWKFLRTIDRWKGSNFEFSAKGLEMEADYIIEGYHNWPGNMMFSAGESAKCYFEVNFSIKSTLFR